MTVIDRSESIHAGQSRLRQFARYSLGALLGTIAHTKGAYKFILDLAESKHIHRAELSALVGLLIEKNVFTIAEWAEALDNEIKLYEGELSKHWPECKPAPDGRSYSLDAEGFRQRCSDEGWPP